MGRKSKAAVSASPSASELSKGEAAAFGSIPRRAKARRFISRGRPGSEHQACNIVVLRRESDESVRGTHQIPEHIRGARGCAPGSDEFRGRIRRIRAAARRYYMPGAQNRAGHVK